MWKEQTGQKVQMGYKDEVWETLLRIIKMWKTTRKGGGGKGMGFEKF